MCTASSLACGPARPRSAGCFVWLPSGCKTPHHLHAKFNWRRDTWGEANAQAGQSEKACKARKQAFDAWCGVTDTVMLLTSPREVLVEDEGGQGEAPEAPEAVLQADAEADAAAEEARAADVVDSLPEAAPALPRSTGCFVWLPSGCKAPRHLHAMSHWRRDAWGEANAKASQGEEACKARKHAFDAFCGVTDAVMLPLLAAPHEDEGSLHRDGRLHRHTGRRDAPGHAAGAPRTGAREERDTGRLGPRAHVHRIQSRLWPSSTEERWLFRVAAQRLQDPASLPREVSMAQGHVGRGEREGVAGRGGVQGPQARVRRVLWCDGRRHAALAGGPPRGRGEGRPVARAARPPPRGRGPAARPRRLRGRTLRQAVR
ncbi:unnamed protein product [Prorocentrum cordatum]|uniref:Uncharacterized protein n=1 Tax=Prorocentrum cordatum TaxID=2364126 RepID=A0ABN9SKA8_9DINO|nr:unnamed protein product [Polarella glacialis]